MAAITNGQAANMHLAEERKELIHFYELTLALLKAMEQLSKEGAA